MKASDRRKLLPFLIPLLLPWATAAAQQSLLSDEEVAGRLRMFAPAVVTADTTRLSPGDRQALRHLIRAGSIIDRIYLRQTVPGGDTLPGYLASDTSEAGTLRRRYFLVNMSPWSALDRYRPIITGVAERKPQKANLYPSRMTRTEWGPWFITLDPVRQAEAAGPHHVVRQDSSGLLKTVPYSEEYRDLLTAAAGHLEKAAALTGERRLKEQLVAIVGSFRSNDYRESERAGVLATGPVSVTMGPMSLSLDEFYLYKRAFEAVVGIRNDAATRTLREMESLLPEIAGELGIPAGKPAPGNGRRPALRIDDAVFAGGAARAGSVVMTLRLPVDSTVIPSSGSKVILLRNVHEANFRSIQAPIASALLDSQQAADAGFEAYFLHLMMRELCSRFEPEQPWKQGADGWALMIATDPAAALAGAKTDAAGLIGLDLMIRKGRLTGTPSRSVYITGITSILRILRFWTGDPIPASAAIQFNFHREQGALTYDPRGGIVRIDTERLKQSVRRLHAAISSLQAGGDLRAADTFYRKYSIQPPDLRDLRERLASVPLDLEPSFPLAD